MGGGQHRVAVLPFRRWREVEIHLLDLGVGIAAGDLPASLVDIALPRSLAGLDGRCDKRELLVWALGRGPAPELEPWGWSPAAARLLWSQSDSSTVDQLSVSHPCDPSTSYKVARSRFCCSSTRRFGGTISSP